MMDRVIKELHATQAMLLFLASARDIDANVALNWLNQVRVASGLEPLPGFLQVT